ncbi:hypothetical protein BKA59DRAFT_527229 [Fusarium tricinctum]|uniref:Uncharacterized protein n=1 Tax=Fusarium tricinctum TaxID=61284 RepID=A0A8K0RY96_9HYPO|nr:hypothetical protein BKA59DRAFT_527229 [Fusarium tricinctum]
MSSNPDQTQEVRDNSLPALSTIQEELENVPLHYEQAKAFINSRGDHKLTTSPSRGSESGPLPLTIEDSAYSSDEAKTTSRNRKRSHSMLSTSSDEISQDNVIPGGYVDSSTTMSDASLDHPLPPITPLSKLVEQRMMRNMKTLEVHNLAKNKILHEIDFNTQVFVPACLKQIQEKHNDASERNNEPTVEVSPAKQQALGHSTNCEREEPDGLVLSEEDLKRADERFRTLRTDLRKYKRWIKLCEERIENEGYPIQAAILRRNLDRLRTANLVLLSPKEIEELNVLVGRFLVGRSLVKEQEEGWA